MSPQSRNPSSRRARLQYPSACRKITQHLLREETGQDMIEYGLIAGLIGLGTLVGVHGAANTIVNMILTLGNNFTNTV